MNAKILTVSRHHNTSLCSARCFKDVLELRALLVAKLKVFHSKGNNCQTSIAAVLVPQ